MSWRVNLCIGDDVDDAYDTVVDGSNDDVDEHYATAAAAADVSNDDDAYNVDEVTVDDDDDDTYITPHNIFNISHTLQARTDRSHWTVR